MLQVGQIYMFGKTPCQTICPQLINYNKQNIARLGHEVSFNADPDYMKFLLGELAAIERNGLKNLDSK